MKKAYLFFGIMSCLVLGCNHHSSNSTQNNHNTTNVSPDSIFDGSPYGSNSLLTDGSEVSLFYDISQTIKIDMKASNAELTIVGNNCVNVLTDSPKTDSDGIATIEINAKFFNCKDGKPFKVCLAKTCETDEDVCTEINIKTTSDDDMIDTNHNLMFDVFETNKDKDKFANYQSGDCSSFCHDDGECEDFCDSAIGYRCSKRCTRDEQCIKYRDDDGNWIQMKCREDGRCAYPAFLAIYDIEQDGATVTMGGHPAEENVTIDWGDGSEKETIPMTTENDLSHTYSKKGRYEVVISGDYRNWTAGCSMNKGIDLYDIQQFGSMGLGYLEDTEQGTFTNCHDFNRMTARDIPDSKKLTDMSYMFAGNEKVSNDYAYTLFNDPAIIRWDTSNVTSMLNMFFNSGKYHWTMDTGFNQDIGRWNTSKLKTTRGMFNSNFVFNQYIGCWDMTSVEDISYMFVWNIAFNQNLSNWNLPNVTQHECVFRYENGHNGDISLKNYCMLRSRVNNENIGRDGNDKVNGDCPELISQIDHINDVPVSVPYQSTCCGIQTLHDVDRTKFEVLCDPGYDYWYACQDDHWKKLVNDCIDKYFKYQDIYKHYTEDTVNCEIIRYCTFAYLNCQRCIEGDPGCPSQKCSDYSNKPKVISKCPEGKDTFCAPDEVFYEYYTTANSFPVCLPCQHLDWSKKK